MILTIDKIENDIKQLTNEYSIKKVTLFGSYAEGNCTEDSDVDLMVEFNTPQVSLFTISGLKIRLQDMLGKDVDIVHAPLPENSLLEVGKELLLYEA